MSSIQAMKPTKKKVNASTLYSTVPQTTGRLYYICSNLKETLSAVITESRPGIDLASHQVVLPGTRSPLYPEHGHVREAVRSPWSLQRE